MFRKIIISFAFVSLLFLQSNTILFAHGDGVSYEETKDGYTADIGRDTEFPVALDQVRFDFLTYPEDLSSAQGEEVYTDVWVRISQDRKLFFSGGINKPEFGSTGFTFVFPEAGSYEMLARFQKDGDTVVEVTYTLEVLPSAEDDEGNLAVNPFITAGVGFLLGAGVMMFIPRKNKNNI